MPEFYSQKFWKEYSTYISVRNPWDRLLSGFSLIKQQDLPAYKPIMDRYDWADFNRFVEEIMTQPELYREDRMFWPQTSWFLNRGKMVKYNKVIRFENLDQDVGSILKKIDMEAKDLPHLLKTKKPHYSDVYNDVSREIVHDIYRRDIDLLKYKY